MGIFRWFSSTRFPEEPGWLRRWVVLSGRRRDPKLERIKRAASEDIAAMEAEDRKYFRHQSGQAED
jgi:hypothetical protein